MDFPSFKNDCTSGSGNDLIFLFDDRWLKQTEVRYFVKNEKGRWQVFLVFIFVQNPYQFLCRRIENYDSNSKAVMFAEYFRRSAVQSTQRILKINEDAFNICKN